MERREKVPEMVRNTRERRQGEESPGSRRPEGRPPVREAPYTGSSSEVEDEEQRRERTPKADPARPRSSPRLGVQVPHPDDDVGRGWNNSPCKFFQKCYDRPGALRGLRTARRAAPPDARRGRCGPRRPWEAGVGEQAPPGLRCHRSDYPEAGHARGALPRVGDRQRSHLVPHRYRTPPCRPHRTLRPPTLDSGS